MCSFEFQLSDSRVETFTVWLFDGACTYSSTPQLVGNNHSKVVVHIMYAKVPHSILRYTRPLIIYKEADWCFCPNKLNKDFFVGRLLGRAWTVNGLLFNINCWSVVWEYCCCAVGLSLIASSVALVTISLLISCHMMIICNKCCVALVKL